MSYQKQAWRDYDDTKTELQNLQNGAVVTPERMNHIETGVANAAVASEVTAQLAQKAEIRLTGNNYIPTKTPTDFGWKDHPLVNKIFSDGKGNYSVSGFDISDFQPTGKTLYVTKNGDDENTGLSLDSSLASLKKAYELGATVILVGEGIYFREEVFFDVEVNRDLTIKGLFGNKVVFTTAHPTEEFVKHGSGNVYSVTTGAPSRMLDIRTIDKNGDHLSLEEVDTLNQVESKSNSYAYISGVLYVHLVDGAEPNNDFLKRFTQGYNISFTGRNTLYLENIETWGGNPNIRVRGSETVRPKVFGKNVKAKYSSSAATGNQIGIQHVELSIFQDSEVAKGLKDGFHYSGKTNAVEINCIGRNNGEVNSGSNQGSTAHSNCTVIRVGGNYFNNTGASVGDDGASAPCESWNLGVKAHSSDSSVNTQNASFMAYDGVKMFIEGSLGYGSKYDLSGAGTIYSRNNSFHSETLKHENTTLIDY